MVMWLKIIGGEEGGKGEAGRLLRAASDGWGLFWLAPLDEAWVRLAAMLTHDPCGTGLASPSGQASTQGGGWGSPVMVCRRLRACLYQFGHRLSSKIRRRGEPW
jgi:hypothetical protein